MKKLDLGCGPRKKVEGSTGVDIRPAPHVDIVHDLNDYPYPFNDNEFEYIEMSHIIEHIEKPLLLMNEVFRIGRSGCNVRIITPHYTSQLSYGDFEHFHHFGYITFLTLQNTGLFVIKKHKLHFTDFYRITGISFLANLWPRKWEKYLSFIFPAMFIEIRLTIQKNEDQKQNLIDRYIY